MRFGREIEHRLAADAREHTRHRLAIADVCLNERDARVRQRLLQVQQAARVRQLVDDDDAIRRVVERVAERGWSR